MMKTVPMQPMSMREFSVLLSEYVTALRARNRTLATWLLGSIVCVFAVLGISVGVDQFMPILVPIAAGIVFLGTIIALALYVVASSSAFHRKHGIRCVRCDSVQIYPGFEMYLLRRALSNGLSAVSCKACAATIARE